MIFFEETLIELITEVEHISVSKNIRIDKKINLRDDLKIHCDEKLIKNQILKNILLNALKYSHESSSILIGAREHAGEVVISIEDSGIGISHEVMKNIFDLNYSSSRGGTSGEIGGGFGLSVAKYILTLMGGRITISNKENSSTGTLVEVSLPILN